MCVLGETTAELRGTKSADCDSYARLLYLLLLFLPQTQYGVWSHCMEPVSLVQVKGRLQDNIAFWKDIRWFRWMLLVKTCIVENGYHLPFISHPAQRKFQNHSD